MKIESKKHLEKFMRKYDTDGEMKKAVESDDDDEMEECDEHESHESIEEENEEEKALKKAKKVKNFALRSQKERD